MTQERKAIMEELLRRKKNTYPRTKQTESWLLKIDPSLHGVYIVTGATDSEQYVRETNYAVINASKDMSQGDGVKRGLAKVVTPELSPEEREGVSRAKSLGKSPRQDQN